MSEPTTPSPVFLLGAPRSGTTWTQLLLSQHPAVATVNETHLFSSYLRSMFKAWESFQLNVREVGLHPFIEEAAFHAMVRTMTDQVYDKVLAQRPGATVALDKTPAHVRWWRNILRIYPECSFVHLVRDPRAVVASLRRAGQGWGKSWADSGIVANARLWAADVASGLEIAGATSNYRQIRYEDLHRDVPAGLRDLLAGMGIECSAGECEAFARNCEAGALKDRGHPAWDTRKEPDGFFGPGETQAWRSELTRGQVRVIEAITGPVARKLGYDIAERRRGGGLRPRLADAVCWIRDEVEWQCRKALRRI